MANKKRNPIIPGAGGTPTDRPIKTEETLEEQYTPLEIGVGRKLFNPLHGEKEQAAEIIPEDFHVTRELMSPGRNSGELDVRAEVNEMQLVHIARARFEAKRFRSKALNAFCDDFLRLSVSLNRKGRKEVVQVHQHMNMGDQEAATGVWAAMQRKASQ